MYGLQVMRALPREVDPVVHNMKHEEPGKAGANSVSYAAVGGLNDQIRELREVRDHAPHHHNAHEMWHRACRYTC